MKTLDSQRAFSVAFASNEPRAKFLFQAMSQKVHTVADIDFDPIQWWTKYLAALLTFRLRRHEWWLNYQVSPRIQRARCRNVSAVLGANLKNLNALFLWGSWFNPSLGPKMNDLPFFVYIDQSISPLQLTDDPFAKAIKGRKPYEMQISTYTDCSDIFCMSDWAYKQTLDGHSYLTADKLHSVGWGPCGIDLTQEKPNFERSARPTVLHVSSDFFRKGVDRIIDVARWFDKKAIDVEFLIIGKDASFQPRNVPPNVNFVGPIYDRKKLANYFRAATLFFLPHRFDRNPHVLVEAMGAGLPLVCSEQGGAIELIQGKQTGILCPSGDIDAYIHAINSIIDDQKQCMNYGQAGYDLATTYYNWDSVASRIISLMQTRLSNT